jgi:hypothetical protein
MSEISAGKPAAIDATRSRAPPSEHAAMDSASGAKVATANTTPVAAAAATSLCRPARKQRRAQRGRSQEHSEAFHRLTLS